MIISREPTKNEKIFGVIVTLIIISLMFLSIVKADYYYYGNTEVDDDFSYVAYGTDAPFLGIVLVVEQNCTLTNSSAYIFDSGTYNMEMALYTYGLGSGTRSLIAVSDVKSISAGFNDWLNFTWSSTPELIEDTNYTLVIYGNNLSYKIYYSPSIYMGRSSQINYTPETFPPSSAWILESNSMSSMYISGYYYIEEEESGFDWGWLIYLIWLLVILIIISIAIYIKVGSK